MSEAMECTCHSLYSVAHAASLRSTICSTSPSRVGDADSSTCRHPREEVPRLVGNTSIEGESSIVCYVQSADIISSTGPLKCDPNSDLASPCSVCSTFPPHSLSFRLRTTSRCRFPLPGSLLSLNCCHYLSVFACALLLSGSSVAAYSAVRTPATQATASTVEGASVDSHYAAAQDVIVLCLARMSSSLPLMKHVLRLSGLWAADSLCYLRKVM